ncbi:MAG TPA: acetyl-CoA carboxylase biotin carboxyl carrier protein [Chroococcidiopsis sp.]
MPNLIIDKQTIVEFDLNQLKELLAILNQTDIAELTLKSNDFELTVRKDAQGGDRPVVASTAPAASVTAPAPTQPVAIPTPAVEALPPAHAPISNERTAEITSPMVGTFYRSPAPDEAAFVELGDRVRSGQTVCIIEAMKLMNEIEAEISGEVIEILVENAQPVEYGQVLMRVKLS